MHVRKSILDHWHLAWTSGANPFLSVWLTVVLFLSHPYFDKGNSLGHFKPCRRTIHVTSDTQIVWFSKLLTTGMGFAGDLKFKPKHPWAGKLRRIICLSLFQMISSRILSRWSKILISNKRGDVRIFSPQTRRAFRYEW